MLQERGSFGRRGFSVLETLTALSIGVVLVSLSVRASTPVRENVAVQSADQAFRGMLARARSQAIERGENAVLHLDAGGDSVWIERGNQVIEGFRFDHELGVDVQTAGSVDLCMTPRGTADPTCGTGTVMTIRFQRGAASSALQVLPLGQIIGT